MAHVPLIGEENASPELKAIYAEFRTEFGFLPQLAQAQGSRPELLRCMLEAWRITSKDGALPQTLKEKIGLVVSSVNSESYCIRMHLEILSRLEVPKEVGQQLVRNYEEAEGPETEKALFRFAAKLTRSPFDVKGADVDELRRHGWDNVAIVEAVHVISQFNLLNRLASGLGVIPEDVF